MIPKGHVREVRTHQELLAQRGIYCNPHNLVEDSFPQIPFAVDRDSRPAPVGMNEDGRASRLPVQGKATPFRDRNHLAGIERRKLSGQTATRTLCEPAS